MTLPIALLASQTMT